MNFQPLGERVLVKTKEPETTTASGIIIPDSASKEKQNEATVLAVSEEVKSVNVNDTVVFGKYAGTQVVVDGTEYLVLETKDILGVIKK
ncbi:MAG: co-chaperone GroES [Campylobacterales bacterium]|nr:co-chaperone GroES [Campylobacterales bacterium]